MKVDPGREFMGAVTKEMENHKTYIRRGRVDIHRDQAIVERFNRTLAERLFGHQYAVEMRLRALQFHALLQIKLQVSVMQNFALLPTPAVHGVGNKAS